MLNVLDLRARISSQSTKIQLPLEKGYRLLKAKANKIGKKFAQDKELRNLLSKRNQSILAHGTTPIVQEEYTKLLKKTSEYALHLIENLNELLEGATFIRWS